jgi:hypothetical protein
MSDVTENTENQTSTEATIAPEATAGTAQESPASTNVDFMDLMSEEVKSLGNIKDFKSIDDFGKSYAELQKLVGNSIRIPSVDASPEAKADFYEKIRDVDGVLIKGDEKLLNKLGKPETADEYEFQNVIPPELIETNPQINNELDDFKSIAHDIGLTKEQAAKLAEMRLKTLEQQEQAISAQRDAAEVELKKIWGNDYQNRLEGAKNVLKIYSEKYKDSVSDLINSTAGNNPAFLNMLSELASMYKEKGHEGMSGTNFGLTPEMAQTKIAEKRSDRGFMEAYNSVHHPRHSIAVAELQKLYAIANGNTL